MGRASRHVALTSPVGVRVCEGVCERLAVVLKLWPGQTGADFSPEVFAGPGDGGVSALDHPHGEELREGGERARGERDMGPPHPLPSARDTSEGPLGHL